MAISLGVYPIFRHTHIPFAIHLPLSWGITMKVAQVTSSRLPTSCGASPAQRTWAVNWTRLVRITTMSKTWSKSWIPMKHKCFRGNSNKLQVTSPPIFVPRIGLWTTILWLYKKKNLSRAITPSFQPNCRTQATKHIKNILQVSSISRILSNSGKTYLGSSETWVSTGIPEFEGQSSFSRRKTDDFQVSQKPPLNPIDRQTHLNNLFRCFDKGPQSPSDARCGIWGPFQSCPCQ